MESLRSLLPGRLMLQPAAAFLAALVVVVVVEVAVEVAEDVAVARRA